MAAVAIVFASAQGIYQTFWSIPGLSDAEATLSAKSSFIKGSQVGEQSGKTLDAIKINWTQMVTDAQAVLDVDTYVKSLEEKIGHVEEELKAIIK